MIKKVAIYARVSTEHESQLSALENQVQYYDELLSRHPDWELYDRYIDEGVTGTSIKKRKNFMRMLEDAKKGCFDLIITREVSRFARNTVDTLQETRKLRRMGIEVYFTEDNIWTLHDDDGELKLTIMATLAQNESKKISQRVKAGQKITFLNGVFYGTGNILGYDKVGKDMVINQEQARTVKFIFNEFLSGKGTAVIKKELELKGYKTATGLKKWNVSTIIRILRNPFYCGTLVYRKSYIPDFLEQKPKPNNGEVEKIVVEGKQEPIISKDDFSKVQKLLDIHLGDIVKGKQTVIGTPKNIWSKKLICECGARFNKRVYHKDANNNKTYSYVCFNQKNNGSSNTRTKNGLNSDGFCNIPTIPEWKLEILAYVLFKKILKDKDRIEQVAFDVLDQAIELNIFNNGDNDEILYIKKSIENNKNRINNLVNAYIDNIIDQDTFLKKRCELDKTSDKLKEELERFEKENEMSEEQVKEKIKLFKENLIDKLNIESKCISEDLIDTFIDKIVVHDNKFDCKLNYLSTLTNPDKDNIGVYFTRIEIRRDDIINYNRKNKIIKRITQKEPIVIDVYI